MKEENILKGGTMFLFGVWIVTAFYWNEQISINTELENDNIFFRSEIQKRDCVNTANIKTILEYEKYIDSAKLKKIK